MLDSYHSHIYAHAYSPQKDTHSDQSRSHHSQNHLQHEWTIFGPVRTLIAD